MPNPYSPQENSLFVEQPEKPVHKNGAISQLLLLLQTRNSPATLTPILQLSYLFVHAHPNFQSLI